MVNRQKHSQEKESRSRGIWVEWMGKAGPSADKVFTTKKLTALHAPKRTYLTVTFAKFSTLEGSRVGAEFVENYLVQENAFICFKSALSFLFCSLLFLSAFSPPPQKEVEATFREEY
ncbi:transmembrane protein, putative [Bodo saltans]|uniref:Transmembrane protein, putative n=1 Tax=Bodo saltans TaxID=75058 RepID=A0A0S4JD95_BODSA|nr:transmembrane protein, putative [Bodo saltans]|eukprot:CUG88226.1 transmembrane protein, putative [Bodo saltans]